MPKSNNTYLGRQWDHLHPFPVEVIRVDDDHRIKVYQFIGRETLLYVPQYRSKVVSVRWSYYHVQTGCNGSYDTWATYDRESAIRKIQYRKQAAENYLAGRDATD